MKLSKRVLVGADKSAVEAHSQASDIRGSRARVVSRLTGYCYSTNQKVVRSRMLDFLYKILINQKLYDKNKPQLLAFAIHFLNRMGQLAVKRLGKPATEPKVPGSNPG